MVEHSPALQYERLRRHFEAALRTHDAIALLDLAHTLRVWADMAETIMSSAPDFARSLGFKACAPSHSAVRFAAGREFVYLTLAGGFVTYASDGKLMGVRAGVYIDCLGRFRLPEGGGLEFRTFYALWPPRDDVGDQRKLFHGERVTRCAYVQWLRSTAVVGALPNASGTLTPFSLSREQLIRRVANEMEASHPAGMPVPAKAKPASEAAHYLLSFQLAGLTLPYFALLKDAADILSAGQKYFGTPHQSSSSSSTGTARACTPSRR
jgi:hypothetical protein